MCSKEGERERERAKQRVREKKSVNLGGQVMKLEEPEEWMNTTKKQCIQFQGLNNNITKNK